MAKPQFKPSFTYANIGNIVGRLTYAKPLKRKDGSEFGYDFLISVKDFGSINVKVPMIAKGKQVLQDFPISASNKPAIRFNLTSIDAYLAQSGKWYLSLTTFNNAETPKEEVTDRAIGRVAGEVAKIATDANGNLTFLLVVYNTDKDGKLVTNRAGQPLEPKVVPITVVDAEVKAEFKQQGIREGANIGIGYAFTNKNDVSYDEFGFPSGSGERVTRIEAKKLVVYSNPAPKQEMPKEDGFKDPFADATEVDNPIDPFADDFDLPF